MHMQRGHWLEMIRSWRVGALGSVVLLGASAGPAVASVETKVAILGGGQVVPATATSASGCARIEIDTVSNTLSYRIVFSGLVGVETVAHFHGPADPGVNGGVLQGLPLGSPKVGTWTYPEAAEPDILGGKVYINIHSTAFPGGEIRGQVVDMVARIDGTQPSPPTGSTGSGFGLFNIDTSANELSYYIRVLSLVGAETAAHIHGFALHGTNAGVVHPLPAASPKTGTWIYAEAQEAQILRGQTYVNIHSSVNPGGEIRGQVTQTVVPVDGGQVSPPVGTPGHGCAFLALDAGADTLSYFLSYRDLTGPATMAHIHGYAPPGANAGVKHNVGTANPAIGAWTYPAGDEPQILAGLAYFNVHTAANPGGEARGQIVFPPLPCPADADCDGNIGFSDLLMILSNWGPYQPCPPHAPADIDRNCDVGFSDLLEVLSTWGPCP